MAVIDYKVTNRVGYITLNRPDKRNALNAEMVSELLAAFSQADSDTSVKVIVLKANGSSFCAGADLGYLQQLRGFSYEENLADSNRLKELFLKIYSLSKVVIAQVRGNAIAGGCGLATVCDFIFSVPEAKFGYTEVKIGFVPAIVMVFLIRKIGEQKARSLLLSGELITASDAEKMGLIYKIASTDLIENEVATFADKLCKNNSADSLKLTKEMIATVQSLSLNDALAYASEMNAKARSTDDCKKGVDAFLNKQDLTW